MRTLCVLGLAGWVYFASAAFSAPPPRAAPLQVASDAIQADSCAAVDPACPGTGNCCEPNGTPGCDNYNCCEDICSADPLCCDVGWTQGCANLALVFCPEECEGDGCPGEGDCCEINGTPGCENEVCCELVCAVSPSCCTAVWGSGCVDRARDLCDLCLEPPCPGDGDCCEANRTPGCENGCCCEVVCERSPACCETSWDRGCAADADDLCPGLCGDPFPGCPGDGDCFVANFSPGCDDPLCCSLVCAQDDACCYDHWDYTCANEAGDICDCPVRLCPGDGGSCCQPNGTPGCNDVNCCEIVCREDPQCCDQALGWDEICVGIAEDVCADLCVCMSFGDFDFSGNVDLADFVEFRDCLTGPTETPLADGCACANSDDDVDVDLIDFAAFHAVFGSR